MKKSKKTKVVILGAGGHGSEVLTYLRRIGRKVEVVGVLDDGVPVGAWNDTNVIGTIDKIGELSKYHKGLYYITAFGNNKTREKVVNRVVEAAPQLRPVCLVDASVWIGQNVGICEGTCVAPNVTLTTNIIIGSHCIINWRASIGHDVVVEDFCNVNPGATICGNVTLGKGAFVGAGATIREKVRVGAGAVIGAGAVVIRDVEPNSTVVGVPAQDIETRNKSFFFWKKSA